MKEPSGCLACDLTWGHVPLPGGKVRETRYWVVEHCVGPLGVGTLLVKPIRHVTTLGDLSPEESAELGPLLSRTAACAKDLTDANQVYVCQWSHAGFEASHIHFVVQPVASEASKDFEHPGPALQVDMFRRGIKPDPAEVEAFCSRARRWFEDFG